MAPFALSAPSSLCRSLLPAIPVISAGRTKALYSTRFKQYCASPVCCRSQLPSSPEANCEQVFCQNFSTSDNETASVSNLLQDCQKVITTTLLGASFLMITFPANALINSAEMVPDIPANDLITPEMVPEILENIFLSLTVAVLYFLVAPLCLYYYLYRRWFKRKMAEAILQFGLVFVFFPGMLLLAPFINFRGAPKEGAKEPWDEIRPSS